MSDLLGGIVAFVLVVGAWAGTVALIRDLTRRLQDAEEAIQELRDRIEEP